MEIRHLQLVESIVEEGSLSKAADKFFLTQSALSHQLKELEQQVGSQLFHRMNKKMIITPVGQRIYDLAKKVLPEIHKTSKEISAITHGLEGEIRLSTECYTSYHWLPPLMKSFNAEYPKVTIKINMNATHNAVDHLLNGKLDVGVTNDILKNDYLDFTEICKDEMVAIVSRSNPLSERKYLVAEDFTNENLIIYSGPLHTVTVYNKVLQPKGIQPRQITELPLTEAAIEMVKANMGVAVFATWAVRPYITDDSVVLKKVTAKGLYRLHYAATLKNSSKPDYLIRFIEFLSSAIQKDGITLHSAG
ncbi:MAG: LysR family transcriptional regulator [Bacteroidetes bacterium]|nr:LysR family transcriptional regulator [Bacteroidota bacterium]